MGTISSRAHPQGLSPLKLQAARHSWALHRYFEIAVAMGRCTWREIEQAAEKCDALLARYESSSERRAHVRDSNGVFVGHARRGG